MQCRRKGFTLIELLVVMAIISILLSVSVAGFFGMGRSGRMRSSVDGVRTFIGLARQQAVFKGYKLELKVRETAPNTDKWKYYVEGPEGTNGTARFFPTGVVVDPSSDMDIPFYPTGSAKDPNEYKIILKQLKGTPPSTWEITVYGLTGMVYIEEK